MDENEIFGELSKTINNDLEDKLKKWIEEHNVNYSFLYPLAAIEYGIEKNGSPEHMECLFYRCVATFLYAKAKEYGKEFYRREFGVPGFKRYLKAFDEYLCPLYQNYRFAREINDANALTKARLSKIDNHKYSLTTSLVSNKYSEEYIYFHGMDDLDASRKEHELIVRFQANFAQKVMFAGFERLHRDVDEGLYQTCIEIVEKDINKWNARVRSEVFDSPKQLAQVLAYFYYYAMLQKISASYYAKDIFTYAANTLIYLNKDKTINDIVRLSSQQKQKVERIVEYLTNDGQVNLMEFPLFEVDNTLVTIPSAIIVNDWQFTVINGHYIKKKSITNREKTISAVTEGRIEKVLENVKNVAVAKTVPYSFKDENGNTQCSDIDFAIYDLTSNMVLVIEAKWIDNHYKDEIDKRYGNIFRTLMGIYNKQISKHQKYLASKENIDALFKNDKRFSAKNEEPQVYYLAVDKRDQMHVDDKHMVSEYLLIYFLNKYIQDNCLDLQKMWDEIKELKTVVEYISISDDYHEIQIGDESILIEKDDLYWDDAC